MSLAQIAEQSSLNTCIFCRKIDPRRLQHHQPVRALVEDQRRICGFAGREQRE